ncbi:12858_t:CDS:2 [Dentiscutata heterogama]|uniref:12858_t:CDS:1 n=1 Tax=Dentiscutata heterogama TaxID=1316150 RepID=A0ACA9K3R6_9GLOM|nr:12858_t:CDS:2 [Dentiscutata heterogama]
MVVLRAVVDISVQVEDKLYFMGGSCLIPSSNPKRYKLSDEMFYLDLSTQFATENPQFTDLTDVTSRMLYGNEKGAAVLGGLNKSNIYLIGGTQVNLSTINWNVTNQIINWNVTDQFIYIYKSETWRRLEQGVKGIQPSRRRSTSTVIKTDGTIYIFGGRIELDMASLSWSNHTANSSFLIQPRVGHTSVLTPDNNSIIITGGTSRNITNNVTDSNETSSKIYLLYIPCLTWESTFTPGRSDCKDIHPEDKNNNVLIIVLIITACLFFLMGICAVVWFIRSKGKWKNKTLREWKTKF